MKTRLFRVMGVGAGLVVLGVGAAAVATPAAPSASKDASFSYTFEVPPAKKGERAVVKLKIAPGAGYHMNKDFPTSLTLVAPAGLALEKPKQAAKDATKLVEAGAEFDVALTSAEPGAKVVTGDLKFAVCSATSCDPKREKVSFTVEVK